MFKGFILSESLRDPTVLNNYKYTYVQIQKHPESQEYPFWHLFKIEIIDEDITMVADLIAKEIKHNWYAHFWNGEVVYIVFSEKIFTIPHETHWSSKEFHQVKKYGMEHGIMERYLDFWIED